MFACPPWMYLKDEDIETIEKYRFKVGTSTHFDAIMNEFWNQLMAFVPGTVAPNTITFLGFLASSLGFLSMMIACSDFSSPIPSHVCFIMALGVFLHQTLDALDGKQARKTKTSSPLGAIFDHGCDIVTMTFFSVSAVALCRCGLTYKSAGVIAVSGHLSQFLYLWWEHQFHIFCSNPGFAAGVTEAQCGLIFLALITGFLGSDIWLLDVTHLIQYFKYAAWLRPYLPKSILLNTFMVICVSFSNLLADIRLLYMAFKNLPKHRLRAAFAQLFSFCIFLAFEIEFFLSVVRLSGSFSFSAVMLIATVYGIIAVRLLFSTTCRKPYELVQKPALPFMGLTLLITYFSGFRSAFSLSRASPVSSSWFVSNLSLIIWVFALGYVIFFSLMVFYTVRKIASVLNISCFSITKQLEQQARAQQ